MSNFLKRSMIIISIAVFQQSIFAQETCTAIDVITSATKKFTTLSGSQYCATTAIIKWQDGYSNGTRYIEWGTSTNYGTQIPLSGKSGTATLSPLTPNTKYYWRVNRSYEGKNPLTPAGSFTTSGGMEIKPPVITSSSSVSCTTGTTKTYTATATDPANRQVTFTFSNLPSWITSSGASLSLKPVTGSENVTVKIIVSNGSAYDTMDLAVTVVTTVKALTTYIRNTERNIYIGKSVIKIPFVKEKTVMLSLFALDGRAVLKREILLNSTNNNNIVTLDPQMTGVYMCRISSLSGEIVQKISISNSMSE